MKNPHNSPLAQAKRTSKALTTPKKSTPANVKQVRAKVQSITKQIDRVRKQIERLEAKAPNSPALARAKQFMAMNGIEKISQTRYIKTTQQYQDYKRFLDKFEKYGTHTVKGAIKAEEKRIQSLTDIMRANGWDPNKYSVQDLYDRLNKIDIYSIMSEYGVHSDRVIASTTIIMNTNDGRKVTAQQILKETFGTMPAADRYGKKVTKSRLSSYNKGTKAYSEKKRKGRK